MIQQDIPPMPVLLPVQNPEVIQRPSLWFRFWADVWTLGLYEIWYHKTRAIVKGEYITIRYGVVSPVDTTVLRSKVTDVRAIRKVMPGTSYVTVGTGSGEVSGLIRHLNRRQAIRFAETIKGVV